MPFIPHVPAFPAVPEVTWQPVTPKPETSKPAVIPHLPFKHPVVPHFHPNKYPYNSHHGTDPTHQKPSIYQHQKLPARIYPMNPLHHLAPPVDTPKPSVQQHLSLVVDQIQQTHEGTIPQFPMMPPLQYSPYPISCPPYPESFCSLYPRPYHHPPISMTTASQSVPWTFPHPTYNPPIPPFMQATLPPQVPVFPPTPPAQPFKKSPSLNCMKNRIMATLPSARADSIKVKGELLQWFSTTFLEISDCNISQYYCSYFDQINAALMCIRDLFQK